MAGGCVGGDGVYFFAEVGVSESTKRIAIVGILSIIAAIVGFMGFGMGDNPSFVAIVKIVFAGVLTALGVAVSVDGDGE